MKWGKFHSRGIYASFPLPGLAWLNWRIGKGSNESKLNSVELSLYHVEIRFQSSSPQPRVWALTKGHEINLRAHEMISVIPSILLHFFLLNFSAATRLLFHKSNKVAIEYGWTIHVAGAAKKVLTVVVVNWYQCKHI